ncbi:MAG: hypothetical protein QNJ68_13500 [Microcoleaceae cyanobacterium MO_207.B10]|nr:hypothetical protein [Microcoleaceae cyanobacterium MO_207.B10]
MNQKIKGVIAAGHQKTAEVGIEILRSGGNAFDYDFFTETPFQKKYLGNLDFYPVNVEFGGVIQEFHIGLGSMAIPGNIAGVFHIHIINNRIICLNSFV